MNLNYITKYLDNKISENNQYIDISFFELRIREQLSKSDTDEFIKYSKIRLKNLGYNVYLTGEKYIYNNETKVVNSNQLIIAIKNE